MKDSEQSGKPNWWINELDSLGIKKSGSNNDQRNSIEESPTSQQLEDLTDYIKQTFIHDYKVCYKE